MDAGVPMKAPVAGIAMGLVKEGDKFAVLTDILGDEDHLGDMDFKVAGTAKGVTALQMDIKIQGITEEIMEIALGQALEARLNILGQMNQVIAQSRSELSANAPTMLAMKIDQDKIRDVIGKGGATIRAICEETKASIDIEDDGSIKIFGETKEAAEAAKQRVLGITAEAEIGKIYVGKVERIVDFGAFVNILPGKDGLVHISQISDQRIEKVTDVLKEGQEVKVLVLDVDNRGRIKLSIKDVAAAEAVGRLSLTFQPNKKGPSGPFLLSGIASNRLTADCKMHAWHRPSVHSARLSGIPDFRNLLKLKDISISLRLARRLRCYS